MLLPELDPLARVALGKGLEALLGAPRGAKRFGVAGRQGVLASAFEPGAPPPRGSEPGAAARAESLARAAAPGLTLRAERASLAKLDAPWLEGLGSLRADVSAAEDGSLSITARATPAPGNALGRLLEAPASVDAALLTPLGEALVASCVGAASLGGSGLPRSGDAGLDAALGALDRARGPDTRFGLAWDGSGPTLFVGQRADDDAARGALRSLRDALEGERGKRLALERGLDARFDVTRVTGHPEDLLRARLALAAPRPVGGGAADPKGGDALGAIAGPASGWLVVAAGRAPLDTFRALVEARAAPPPAALPRKLALACLLAPERALAGWEGRSPRPAQQAWLALTLEGPELVVRAALPPGSGGALGALLEALLPHVKKGLGRLATLPAPSGPP